MSAANFAPFMPAILERLATRLHAEVFLEPEFRIVGRIRFRNGRESLFWHHRFNLNSDSSTRVAGDKGYAGQFLRAAGLPVPRFQTFFSDRLCAKLHASRDLVAAGNFAERLGWPVFVKPCRGSQGAGIERVGNRSELRAAARRIFRETGTLLVQEACAGRDYRLVVLDGKVISAYERVPLAVTGDGTSTIRQLLVARQQDFERVGRDTRLDFDDRRFRANLRRLRLGLKSVPARGRRLTLLEVANLSRGGESIDVTADVHPYFARLARRAAQALDLRFAGVDLIAPDITRKSAPHWILEVNAAPGLDHYAGHGKAHQRRIDALYLHVLRAIERGPSRR